MSKSTQNALTRQPFLRAITLLEMSAYANYGTSSSAQNYLTGRKPVAVEVILGAIARAKVSIGKQEKVEKEEEDKEQEKECRVLDAGCGPGNYLPLVAPHVDRLDAIDCSEAMLKAAQERCKGHNNISYHILNMNHFDWHALSVQYDAIYCCQVLQHLQIDNRLDGEKRFAGAQTALNAFYKYLKPGGALIINLCTANQRRHGFWWASLLPKATERIIGRVPQPEELAPMLRAAGFSDFSVNNMRTYQEWNETLQQESEYNDAFGPLRAEWRVADSTWALADDEELESALNRIRTCARQDEWQRVAEKMMLSSKAVGQHTTYVVYK